MDKSHPLFVEWIKQLKSTGEPRGYRCPIVYDTKLKDYVYSPMGLLVKIAKERFGFNISIENAKEEGRARNGSYKECRMRQNRDDRVYLVSLPWDIQEALGINNGNVRIYLSELNEENKRRLYNKVLDLSELAAREELTAEQEHAVMCIRDEFAKFDKGAIFLNDLCALPQFSFKTIGVLLKTGGDSFIRNADIDELVRVEQNKKADRKALDDLEAVEWLR